MLLFSIQAISATNITVHPGDSIQNAVNKASNGDNITVYDNNNKGYTYKESISINKKVSIKASGNVTIEAKNSSSSVFLVNSAASGTSIENFIMTQSDYCITINKANSCIIANNVISGASLVGIQFYGDVSNTKVTGNTIIGVDPTVGNGISFEYGLVTNNIITGNNISNFLNGILFNNNSENNTVSNNIVSCTNHSGVGIYTTDNARGMIITGNTVTGAEDGIAVQQMGTNTPTNFTISGNILNGNKNGFWLCLSNSTISNNNATGNLVSGIDLTGKYNQILNNTASNNGNCGITLGSYSDADYNTVKGNKLSYNQAGINSASNYSNISGNWFTNNSNNGAIITADHVTMAQNIIENNDGGILLIGTYNTLDSNTINNNSVGIDIQSSGDADYNWVTNNILNYNNNGINSGSPYTELNNNTVNNSVENGIINTANNVVIKGNTVLNSGGTGILSVGSYVNILNNVITGNNLGIYLISSGDNDYNILTNNTICYNINGINSGSNGTNFYNNTLNYNNGTGLIITGSNCNVVGNSMCYNKDGGLTVTGTNNVVVMNRLEQNLYGASFSNYNAAFFSFNSVIGNTYQLYSSDTSGTLNAINNWWGSNSAPARIYGYFNVSPWIVLKLVSSSNNIIIGYVSNITADLTWNSAGENTALLYPGYFVPDGILVNFNCDSHGSLSNLVLSTVNGTATTIFTGKNNGSSIIYAIVNDQNVSNTVNVMEGTSLAVNSTNGYKGNVVKLVATLKDGNNQPLSGKYVKFFVNGTLVGTATTNSDGLATYSYIITQNSGSYTISATYTGDSNYAASYNTNNLQVNLTPTAITTDPVTGYKGDKVNLTATLNDINASPLSGKTINFYINGTLVGTTTTNTNGTANYLYTLNQLNGYYTIMAIFSQDGTYTGSNGTSNMNINLIPTIITVSPFEGLKGDYVNLTATLKDYKGSAIVGKTVYFSINGLSVGNASTDENGVAVLTVNLISSVGLSISSSENNIYVVLAQFFKDDTYGSSENSNNQMFKSIPSIIGFDSTTGHNGTSLNLVASLKDNNNKPIIGRTVWFYIEGNEVGTAQTNDNGTATLVYNVSQLSKNYNLMVKFLGDDDYIESESTDLLEIVPAKTILSLTHASSYSGYSTSLMAALHDGIGANLSGKIISFFVDNQLIGTAITNSDGIATLIYSINSQGSHSLFAQFNDGVEYNSSSDTNSWIVNTVPSKLISKPMKGYKGDKLNLTATLINTIKNTPVSGKTVYFYVNGKLVGSGITNSSGIASYIYLVKNEAGYYSLLAQYKTDSFFTGYSYNTTMTVQKMLTKTTTSSASGKKNCRVKLSATLSNLHTNTKIGNTTVRFYISGKLVGSGKTNKYGVASFYYTAKLKRGTYTITAKYLSNTTYVGSSNSNKLKLY